MSTTAAAPARRRVRTAPTECPKVPVLPALRERVEAVALEAVNHVLDCFEGGKLPTCAAAFQSLEERLLGVAQEHVVGPVVGAVLAALHEHEQFVLWSMRVAREREQSGRLVGRGDRTVTVTVAGGGEVALKTPYMEALPPASKPGPRRAPGTRGKGGAGLYPVLAGLGFVLRTSPYVTLRTARMATLVDSYQEARETLVGEGIRMDEKAISGVVERVGDAGLFDREHPVAGLEAKFLAGKRVMVCVDGGRLRYRLEKTGRRRKSGHHGFDAPWREPKVLAIYLLDERGKKTDDPPIYEGTLAPWEDAATLIASTLTRFGAREATVLAFAADGSDNIWRHVDAIVAAAGVAPEKVVRFVDFYHALEHLHDAAKLVLPWSEQQRQQWVKKQAKRLRRGRVAQVEAALQELAVTDSEALAKEVAYFHERLDLMRYDQLRARGLPLGTGAVESAIRRVVNLRLKGTGIFWEPANAERMLYLRCRLKAGRWDEVERALHRSALTPARGQVPSVLERLTV
ncbi:MAG: hypothetical protein ACOZNI_00425 [Myxococcota bacterium]